MAMRWWKRSPNYKRIIIAVLRIYKTHVANRLIGRVYRQGVG
jgi:hypothetical protein